MTSQLFSTKTKKYIQSTHKIQITLQNQPFIPIQQVYSFSSHQKLHISQLRSLLTLQKQYHNQDIQLISNKIIDFIDISIKILQNNQSCRMYLIKNNDNTRQKRQNRPILNQLAINLDKLQRLIQQCRHGISSKSELITIINNKSSQLFNTKVQQKLILQEIILLDMPELLQQYTLLNQDTYLILYESIIQKLLIYKNTINQYIQGRLSFYQFQQICQQIIRQDVFFNNNKINQLVKYVWYYCYKQVQKYNKMMVKLSKLRSILMKSILKVYYMSIISKDDINYLQKQLIPIQNYIIQSLSSQDGINLGRNSSIVQVNQTKILELQVFFQKIIEYITNYKENIFILLYDRKLKKRISRLYKIQQKITHLFKLKHNKDYSNYVLSLRLQKNTKKDNISQDLNKLKDYYDSNRPLNQNQFKMVYQQLQRIAMMRPNKGTVYSSSSDEYKIIQFQKMIMNDYLFYQNGQRKIKKQTAIQKFKRSNVNISVKLQQLKQLQVKRQQVFQDTIDDINNTQPNIDHHIDATKIYLQGRQYLQSIRPQYGQQFMDMINFRLFLLPKLNKSIQKAISITNYSTQPLYLQLTSLRQNINIIIEMIRPDLNQKKIDLIFYPKVNSNLFTMLKMKLIDHQQKLSKIYLSLLQSTPKNNIIQTKLKQFIQLRLRYLYILLQSMPKLQELAIQLNKLNLIKNTYDITSQNTYNIILKLLLAQKEIKVYRSAVVDRINDKNISSKGIKLLSEYIYPNFSKSLMIIFQYKNKEDKISVSDVLQKLLNLAEESRMFMEESNKSIKQVLKLVQSILSKQISRNILQVLSIYKDIFNKYFNEVEYLINQSSFYNNISVGTLSLQRVRVHQFMQLCQYGSNLKYEIIDQRSKYFRNLLKNLKL